jgi:hypothetical protein
MAKLYCNLELDKLTDMQIECGNCKICLPESNLIYPFDRDLQSSEMLVNELIKLIDEKTQLVCRKTEVLKYPDLSVCTKSGKLVCRVEAKYLSGKAFMKVKEMLGDNLHPKETLVLDEPKLISYFECSHNDRRNGAIPTFIVWKFDRPCKDVGGITVYQNLDVLEKIYLEKKGLRKFRRKTGIGDHIGNRRIGIIDKYHFSIRECKPIELFEKELVSMI